MSNEQRVVELTAMAELIEFGKNNPPLSECAPWDFLMAKATELLAKEKSQIVDAFNAAEFDPLFDPKYENAEDYYSLTYKQINVREL